MADTVLRWGRAFWPGCPTVQSCHYTQGHGISPGTAILTINPSEGLPVQAGDLVFTDGLTTITVPDCRLDSISSDTGGGGTIWRVVLHDRRWKWRQLGIAVGTYNQIDSRGILDYSLVNIKLPQGQQRATTPTRYIPWTLRSAKQLAGYLLAFMGETRYTLLIPESPLHLLPPIDWDYVNPAQALQQLCDSLGCRIVYQLDPSGGRLDRVLIVPQGVGADLPDGPISHDAPSFSNLKRPDSIVLVGAPVRFQIRMQLQAVGEEWNGRLVPIEALSYAPLANVPRRMNARVTIAQPTLLATTYTVTIGGFASTYTSAPLATDATIYTGLAAAITATIAGQGTLKGITATTQTTYLEVLGYPNGQPFTILLSATHGSLKGALIDPGLPILNRWAFADVAVFGCVRATDQLTREQAIGKAKGSVFKKYQVVNVDITNPNGSDPLEVPELAGVGTRTKLTRKEQLMLQDNRLEMVLPSDQDTNFLDHGNFLVKNFYAGLEKTKPATAYGAIATAIVSKSLTCTRIVNFNTPEDSEIPVSFSIDKDTLTVTFASPVYFQNGVNGKQQANIMLETAVQIRHPRTNHPIRFTRKLDLGTNLGSDSLVIKKNDVQLNIIARYDADRNLIGTESDVARAEQQSAYYLAAEARKLEIIEGRNRSYDGLLLILLDGAVSQVTWEVGGNGATTQASRNSEHNYYVPTYPERIRVEYLDAVKREDQYGLQERAFRANIRKMAEGRDA